MVSLDCQAPEVLAVSQETLHRLTSFPVANAVIAHQDHVDPLGPWDDLVPPELLGLQGALVAPGILVGLDLVDPQGTMGIVDEMDYPDLLVHLDNLEPVAARDFQDPKDHVDLQVLPDHEDSLEAPESLAREVQQDHKVHLDARDLLAHPDPKDDLDHSLHLERMLNIALVPDGLRCTAGTLSHEALRAPELQNHQYGIAVLMI